MMNRRTFLAKTVAVPLLASAPMSQKLYPAQQAGVRIGGNIYKKWTDPESWVASVKDMGYTAAYCPLSIGSADDEVSEYKKAALKADIVIAEVGAWSNPLSPNDDERNKAIEKCIGSLDLADRIGARCCVNVSGSKSETLWYGIHSDNLTDDTFDLIVETYRKIIDTVKPKRTFFTLEMMPWLYPDSPDSYFQLIKAIDRERFAVHLDPVNIVNSPQRYFNNAALIDECFKKLGPYIKSCHAKDIVLQHNSLSTHLDEILPGKGYLNYGVFLKNLSKLDAPLMIEHLASETEYREAFAYLRQTALNNGVNLYK